MRQSQHDEQATDAPHRSLSRLQSRMAPAHGDAGPVSAVREEAGEGMKTDGKATLIRIIEPPVKSSPFRLRCLTEGCAGPVLPDAEDEQEAERNATIHAQHRGHRVAIEHVSEEET